MIQALLIMFALLLGIGAVQGRVTVKGKIDETYTLVFRVVCLGLFALVIFFI